VSFFQENKAMNDLTLTLTIEFGYKEFARRFLDAMTGKDDDVVLAMEKAAQKALGAEGVIDVRLHPPVKADVKDLRRQVGK
jgi:hypothetical protein